MFANKIVFILGAGASAEVELPLGRELAHQIAQKMTITVNSAGAPDGGDHDLFVQAADGEDFPTYLRAANRLRDGLPVSESIDEFLDLHRRDTAMVKLGKTAIVRTILEAESQSRLFFPPGNSLNFDSVREPGIPSLCTCWRIRTHRKCLRMLSS